MPFQIELSADEPVVYEVSYAEQSVSEEAQTYTPSFIAAEGLQRRNHKPPPMRLTMSARKPSASLVSGSLFLPRAFLKRSFLARR